MAVNYGKKFKKNGRMVRYRYVNGRKSTKKLVSAYPKKRKSSFRGYRKY